MPAPGFYLALGNAECQMTRALRAMQWNGASIDNNSLALSTLRIEQEQNAFLTAKGEVPTWNRKNFGQPQHLSIKAFGRF
jgi:hypothetical protein